MTIAMNMMNAFPQMEYTVGNISYHLEQPPMCIRLACIGEVDVKKTFMIHVLTVDTLLNILNK